MPQIGGTSINWDESKPAGTDSVSIGDDQARSDKTAVRTAIAAEHVFDAAGGANTGAHVLGSARPFYGAQSLVSSTGSDGRLMLTSDTSRLFAVGSGGTVFLGGAGVISAGSYPGTVPQRAYWAMEFGQARTSPSGTTTVSYPNSGFSGVPYIMLSVAQGTPDVVVASTLAAGSALVSSFDMAGNVAANILFNWLSVGTRTL